jgi:hypothetical protein
VQNHRGQKDDQCRRFTLIGGKDMAEWRIVAAPRGLLARNTKDGKIYRIILLATQPNPTGNWITRAYLANVGDEGGSMWADAKDLFIYYQSTS